MTLGVVKMMHFLYNSRKLIPKGGVSDLNMESCKKVGKYDD